MFRKNPGTKPSANIKSLERRSLLHTICTQYGVARDALSREQEERLVPQTTKIGTFVSFQDDRGSIYYDLQGQPLWFKTRDSQLYPTLFTLWRVAYLLPIVKVQAPVVDRLVGFANLMLPGCVPPFEGTMQRGALVAVASRESPNVAVAIGHCALNLTQFDEVVGRQGTAVTILHSLDDALMKLYDRDWSVPGDADPSVPTKGDEREEGDKGEGDEREEGEQKELLKEEKEQEKEGKEQTDKELSALPTEDIDNFFVRAFIQAVKVSPFECPITSSKLMSDHILKNLPAMDTSYRNIKKTSWKKTAKYLKALEKMGYITLKGKGDDVTVTAVTVPKDIVANFVTHKVPKPKSATVEKTDKLLVVLLYKPTKKSRMFFNALDREYDALYTVPELKGMYNDYIKQNGLAAKNPKNVELDELLKSICLVAGGPREQVFDAFLKNFSPYSVILQPGEEMGARKATKGAPAKIRIVVSTVLGRKTVTTISNFEPFHIRPSDLQVDLQNKCSGSATIHANSDTSLPLEVLVQGAHDGLVASYLRDKGVPPAYIDVVNKSKKKK